MKWATRLHDANHCCYEYTPGRFRITEQYKPGMFRVQTAWYYDLYMDGEYIGRYDRLDDAQRIAEGMVA